MKNLGQISILKKKAIENIIKTFQNIDLEKQNKDTQEKKIIFILGMPRSGTTLTEQIIASHSKVYGAGELIYFQQVIKKNFSSLIKPIIQNDYVFFITKNNLIISMNLNSGKIIYSYDINQQISDFLNTKKRYVQFKDFILANNEIIIFLKNSYILNYKINGKLKDVKKLPSKINSQPIFINSSLLFLNKKNKILILD